MRSSTVNAGLSLAQRTHRVQPPRIPANKRHECIIEEQRGLNSLKLISAPEGANFRRFLVIQLSMFFESLGDAAGVEECAIDINR